MTEGPQTVGRTTTTGGPLDGLSETVNARARRRLLAAAPRWQRPAVVVTNLEGFVGIQLARLMHRHGVPVVALSDRPRDPLTRTRVVDAVFDAGPDGRDTARVLAEIAQLFPERPVLMPCSDIAVAAVSAARASLDYHLVLPEHEVIELLTDKPRFLDHAQANGIPVSPFWVLQSRPDAEDVAARLRYPVVMKPYRGTMAWNDSVGQKAVRVFDSTRLLETWDLAAPDYPVLVQEWVEGGDDQLYSFNGYFDASGQPLATFIARKLRQWPPHTGMSSLGVECRNDVILETALRLFTSVPYRGFAYLEMKRDARTGQHYAIEANIGRPTGRSPIAEAGGVELHYTAYCDALGLPLPTARTQRYGSAKWIYFARDASSAWYYRRSGHLTLRTWLSSLRGVKADAVFSWRDPLPFVLDSASGLARVVRREPVE
jgi:predicted ATP-grasp superfamily ATP-dependent carboligase